MVKLHYVSQEATAEISGAHICVCLVDQGGVILGSVYMAPHLLLCQYSLPLLSAYEELSIFALRCPFTTMVCFEKATMD